MSCVQYEPTYKTTVTYDVVRNDAWTGVATNKQVLVGDGAVQFSVLSSVAGVALGFADNPNSSATEYSDLLAGVLFANFRVYSISSGSVENELVNNTYPVYTLLRSGASVHLFGSFSPNTWGSVGGLGFPYPGEHIYTFDVGVYGVLTIKTYMFGGTDTLQGGVVSTDVILDVLSGGVSFLPAVVASIDGDDLFGGVSLKDMQVSGSETDFLYGGVYLAQPLVVGYSDESTHLGAGRVQTSYYVRGVEGTAFTVDYIVGYGALSAPQVGGWEFSTPTNNTAIFEPGDVSGFEYGDTGFGGSYLPHPHTVGYLAIEPTTYLISDTPYVQMRNSEFTRSQREITNKAHSTSASIENLYVPIVDSATPSVGHQTWYNPESFVEDVVEGAVSAKAVLVAHSELSTAASGYVDAVEVLHLVSTMQSALDISTSYTAFVHAVLATRAVLELPAIGKYTESSELHSEAVDALFVSQVASWADEVFSVLEYDRSFVFVVHAGVAASAYDFVGSVRHLLQTETLSTHAWAGINIGGEVHTSWVVNLDGAMPISEYTNFGFNSYARVGSRHYAAKDTGLYVLEGDTDDGEPINASVRSMLVDFGLIEQKRVVSAYIGCTSTGRVILKIKSVDQGALVETWFEARQKSAAPANTYMPLGRGLRSRHWQVELVNVDGADFDIVSLDLHPLPLGRRV